MFASCEILENSLGVDNEILMRYISENLNGTIPYRYQQTENRIIKTDGKGSSSSKKVYYEELSDGVITIIIIAPIMAFGIIIAIIFFIRKMAINKLKDLLKFPQDFERFTNVY